MNKANSLMGLIANYGDSDSEEELSVSSKMVLGHDTRSAAASTSSQELNTSAAVHPAPIQHCPWIACYDDQTGFTYYWNQLTNETTWEAPPEYLLAVKLARQQLNSTGSTEVSAEEWQLYQQALAEKHNSQNKVISKPAATKQIKSNEKVTNKEKNVRPNKRKIGSDNEEEKIELITSYHNSDSESNEEPDSPRKPAPAPKPVVKTPKNSHKKQKSKPQTVEYGPPLPPNQSYTIPIGPQLPPHLINENKTKSPDNKVGNSMTAKTEEKKNKSHDLEDSQDENTLLMKLKDKAKLLEKLGGEIPSDLQKIIEDEMRSRTASPAAVVEVKDSKSTLDIDDLLEEVEKKELPKVVKSRGKVMTSGDSSSGKSSPKSNDGTPPREVVKPLFPSSKTADCENSIFPSEMNKKENGVSETKSEVVPASIVAEKKGPNLYLMDANEPIGNVNRKKRRISKSVLPERKIESPIYTTKYSNIIDGFTSERTGLGFSADDEGSSSPKNTISYGNGVLFTKGETLNEEKKDEDLDDLTDLLDAKLKFLYQQQPCQLSPIHEMCIQMQCLVSAFRAGALSAGYWRRWALAAAAALRRHERRAAPAGWTCSFQRSEGRYRYRREADGLVQWEYPAAANMDMDICTTPPPSEELKEEHLNPPPSPPPAPAALPAPVPAEAPAAPPVAPPAPAPPAPPAGAWPRPRTPPPPAWADPPPPGCDDLPPLPPQESKKEICDELLSFYNDIAELEKQSSEPHTAPSSPEPPLPAEKKEKEKDKERDKEKLKDQSKICKKKSKVKISSSMGLKHKSVSSMVAKWQQVADEIGSD